MDKELIEYLEKMEGRIIANIKMELAQHAGTLGTDFAERLGATETRLRRELQMLMQPMLDRVRLGEQFMSSTTERLGMMEGRLVELEQKVNLMGRKAS